MSWLRPGALDDELLDSMEEDMHGQLEQCLTLTTT